MQGTIIGEEPEVNTMGAALSTRKTVIYEVSGERFRGAMYMNMKTGGWEYDFGAKPSSDIHEGWNNAYRGKR